jgi:RNA-directed DNA polymerase
LYWFWEIKGFVEKSLLLNLKNEVKLLPITNGADFLGYIIRPYSIYVRKRVLNNFKKKIKEYNNLVKNNDLDDFEKKQFSAIKASYFGHLKHANCFKIKNEFIQSIQLIF